MAACPTQEIELCQFQGNQIGFVLSLGTFFLYRLVTLLHLKVVLMNALQRIPHNLVTLTALFQQLKESPLLSMRFIAHAHLHLDLRNL